MTGMRVVGPVLAVLTLGLMVGCSPARTIAIVVDQVSATADTGLRIQLTGVEPGDRVELTAESEAADKTTWRSRATLIAGDRDTVDLGVAKPITGSYSEADAMGLFWSMDPDDGSDPEFFTPPLTDTTDGYDVVLTATAEHGGSARASLHRVFTAAGVSHRGLTLATDKVTGELYRPATASRGSVLLLGGSEGGISLRHHAALLASHGYTALALGYFALPGLPWSLVDIPIEYFATAARLLPGPLTVLGYSRGSEAALLLSALYPDLVRDIIVYAPADRVHPAVGPPGNAWTYGGRPQTTIAFERIAGKVLAIAGTDDKLWKAPEAATHIAALTGGESLLCTAAGHTVGGLPYLPAGTRLLHPVLGQMIELGGTRPANEKAHREVWTRVLGFLAGT